MANDKQMLKGGAIPKLDYAIIGDLFGDDKITGELKVNTDGKTVGDFDITQGTLAVSSNYKLTFEKGKLSVADKTPQNIIVADFGEKTYGDAAFAVSITAAAAAVRLPIQLNSIQTAAVSLKISVLKADSQ